MYLSLSEGLVRAVGTCALIAALCGCTSNPVVVAPQPPANYERLGPASGSASGSLGVVSTAYYVVPMGINSRVARAYENAIASVPGATGLVDVSIQESWFWWVIGTARTTTVSGEAIREVTE